MSEKNAENQIIAMMSGEDQSIKACAYRSLANLIVPFYRWAIHKRNQQYDLNPKKSHQAHCPVISIGNITTGGVGKTPMVIWTVKYLRILGYRPAVIIRGYKSGAGDSDEAVLLNGMLNHDLPEGSPSCPVVVEPDRVKGAEIVQSEHKDVDVIVLDDGFQHRRIKRDLDIVLIDATNPFGYDHLLPRGLMREPISALRRADLIVLTHAEAIDERDLFVLNQRLCKQARKPAIAVTMHHWSHALNDEDKTIPMSGQPVIAACGIGNPRAYFAQAREHFTVLETHAHADHYTFSETWLKSMQERCTALKCDTVLVTEKDWVKIKQFPLELLKTLKFLRPQLGLRFIEGEGALNHAVANTLMSDQLSISSSTDKAAES